MDFLHIKDENTTEEELIEILKHNSEVLRLRKNEIKKLKEAATSSIIEVKEAPSIVNVSQEPIKEEIDTDFEEEVDFYMNEIRNIKDELFDEAIYDVLPVRTHYAYKKIILRIIAEFNKDIKEINEILIAEQDSLDIDELNEYKNEIISLNHKKELLKKALREEIKTSDTKTTENRLIFVPTPTGNIRVIEDLKFIPSEYYDAFIELFKSIKDGTFKRIKRFSNSSSLSGLLEVKDFKIRVFFDRLSKDSYAIIGASLKKFDTDKAYRLQLVNKYSEYKKMSKKLKEQLVNPDFINLHADYEKELFKLLGNNLENEIQVNKNGGTK